MSDLESVLADYHNDVVRAIVKRHGLSNAATKSAAVVKIATWLDDAQRVRNVQGGLDSAENTLITRLVQFGGSVRSSRLEHVLVQDGVIRPPIRDSRSGRTLQVEGRLASNGTPTFADLIIRLTVNGLLLTYKPAEPAAQLIKWVPGRVTFIPQAVLDHLDASQLADLPDIGTLTPAYTRTGSVVSSQRDINNYVRTVRRDGPIAMTTTGMVYKTALKKLAEAVNGPSDLGRGKKENDSGYLFFLRRMLTTQKLLIKSYDKVTAAETTHPFWGLDSAERIKATFVTWRDTGAWNGPRMLPSYHRGVEITDNAQPQLALSRSIILNHLRQLGTGWVSRVKLVTSIESDDYGFLFPDRDQEPSSFGYYYYHQTRYERSPYSQNNNPQFMSFDTNIKDEFHGWERVEAAYIAHALAGPLHWMGLVDLGYHGPPPDDINGLQLFDGYRLTPYGAWLLGIGEKPEVASDSGGGIILQPNFEILAMAPIPVETLMMLDAFATVKDSQAMVTTYELTRESVYRGQQGRWQVADIKAFFDEHGKMPIPDNVRRTLDEWDGLYNRITIRRRVSVAEVATAEIATALGQLDAVKQATDTVVVSPLPLQEMATVVRDAGYLPLRTHVGDRSASNSVHIADDGLVTFAHPMPSIFAKQLLADISVELNDTQRQILPSMVRSYTRNGDYFAEFFGRIKRLHTGELSLKLTNNLKSWANYYGDAQQAQLILTEFKDHETLRELIDDPELTNYLTPLKGSNRPLAIIAPEHRDLVNERLKERGVTITEGIS